MASFDDLAFAHAGADTGHGLCLACLSVRTLTHTDRVCPTCALPLRRLSPQEYEAIRAILAQHARSAAAAPAVDDEDEEGDGSRARTHAQALAHSIAAAISSSNGSTTGGGGEQGLFEAFGMPAGAPDGGADLDGMMALAALGGLGPQLDGILTSVLSGEAETPAAAHAVATLHKTKVVPDLPVAEQLGAPVKLTLRVPGAGGGPSTAVDFTVVPAVFGPRPAVLQTLKEANFIPFVACKPFSAAPPLENATALHGAVAYCERGVVPFARKVLAAQAAGATAVIVAQTTEDWPMEMADAAGDATNTALGGPARIPAVMLSKADAARVSKVMESRPHSELRCCVHRPERLDPCSVCVDTFNTGETLVKLPCGHWFHEACITPWLRRRHTCPLCRFALPAADEDEVLAARLGAMQNGSTSTPEQSRATAAAASQLAAALRRAREEAERARRLARERESMAESWYV